MQGQSDSSLADVIIVVAIVLLVIATAIPNLLLAGIADSESRARRSSSGTKFSERILTLK